MRSFFKFIGIVTLMTGITTGAAAQEQSEEDRRSERK